MTHRTLIRCSLQIKNFKTEMKKTGKLSQDVHRKQVLEAIENSVTEKRSKQEYIGRQIVFRCTNNGFEQYGQRLRYWCCFYQKSLHWR